MWPPSLTGYIEDWQPLRKMGRISGSSYTARAKLEALERRWVAPKALHL